VNLLEALVGCSIAATADDVVKSVSIAAEDLGFPFFAVFEAATACEWEVLIPILGRSHESWLARYWEADLAGADFRLRKARLSSRDFSCSEVLKGDQGVTAEQRQFFVEAKTFGLRDSYVLPYRTAGGRVFAAVLIGPGREITPELRVKIRTLSHELLLAALRIRADTDSAKGKTVRLTARQLECLAMIRDGRRSAEIAKGLKISVRTVEHYVANACTRLGVRNRAQAVAKAIGEGLIDHPAQNLI
jgi:LuxR family transcriptional activator of conjugal transfer of Ti plasmids